MSESTAPRKRTKIVAIVIGAVLAAGLGYAGVTTYTDQLKTVESFEHKAAGAHKQAEGTETRNPRMLAFRTDPVFKTQGWADLIAERTKRAEANAEQAVALMNEERDGIWWPDLKSRAAKAVGDFQAAADNVEPAEISKATLAAENLCRGTARSVETRVADWSAKNPAAGASPYDSARAAVMPDVIRASAKYLCP